MEDDDMESMLESCGANSFFTLVRARQKKTSYKLRKTQLYDLVNSKTQVYSIICVL